MLAVPLLLVREGQLGHEFMNLFYNYFPGMASSALANPTDVLKVRLQAAAKASSTTIYDAFRKIYKFEGVKGLWRVRRKIFFNFYPDYLDITYLFEYRASDQRHKEPE